MCHLTIKASLGSLGRGRQTCNLRLPGQRLGQQRQNHWKRKRAAVTQARLLACSSLGVVVTGGTVRARVRSPLGGRGMFRVGLVWMFWNCFEIGMQFGQRQVMGSGGTREAKSMRSWLWWKNEPSSLVDIRYRRSGSSKCFEAVLIKMLRIYRILHLTASALFNIYSFGSETVDDSTSSPRGRLGLRLVDIRKSHKITPQRCHILRRPILAKEYFSKPRG